MIDQFLTGAIATCLLIGGWFFLHYWRESKDQLFLYFAISFFIMSANRVALAVLGVQRETGYLFLIRFAAFCLILIAIWQKNRPNPHS